MGAIDTRHSGALREDSKLFGCSPSFSVLRYFLPDALTANDNPDAVASRPLHVAAVLAGLDAEDRLSSEGLQRWPSPFSPPTALMRSAASIRSVLLMHRIWTVMMLTWVDIGISVLLGEPSRPKMKVPRPASAGPLTRAPRSAIEPWATLGLQPCNSKFRARDLTT